MTRVVCRTRHRCNLAAEESGLQCTCVNNDDFTALISGGVDKTMFSELVYCVAIICQKTEWGEQWICIKFCIKLEHSSVETIQMIHKAKAMGNWRLAASSQQHAHSCIMCPAPFLGETLNCPGDSAPLKPRFGALWLLAFPKTKITFEREEISDCCLDSGK